MTMLLLLLLIGFTRNMDQNHHQNDVIIHVSMKSKPQAPFRCNCIWRKREEEEAVAEERTSRAQWLSRRIVTFVDVKCTMRWSEEESISLVHELLGVLFKLAMSWKGDTGIGQSPQGTVYGAYAYKKERCDGDNAGENYERRRIKRWHTNTQLIIRYGIYL